MARSLVPAITMLIATMYFQRKYSLERKYAVVPIVIGVCLAFYGDISVTLIGMFYTFLCVILAALKVTVGGELLTGDLKLHEIDLLSKVCSPVSEDPLFLLI
jgi:hypothetical protein